MAAIESEPVKSLCGDENAIEKFMGKRKFGEEEDSNSSDDDDVEEVVSKPVEYDDFNGDFDGEHPHVYHNKAMYLEFSNDECSDIVHIPWGCTCGCNLECKEDFKFPMFIGKYGNYVLTSIEPFVKEVMKTVSDSNVVLVTNLLRETTDTDLLDLFKPYGNVTSAKVARCPHTGVTGRFGFVYFDNREGAQLAIHILDRTIPKHIKSTIGVEWAPATPTTRTTTTTTT